ncbi:MAG: hypothetical protein SGPRY_005007, partial [Prymnesium sp.]
MALARAQQALAEEEEQLRKAKERVASAEQELLLATRAELCSSLRPRSVAKAYVLWAFTPLLWPGGYLFYLGRDSEAVLQTITFGGFFFGWLADALFIPTYVADANEKHTPRERQLQHSAWISLCTLLSPLRWVVQITAGTLTGYVAFFLLPRPWLIQTVGLQPAEYGSCCFGAVCTALTVKRCANLLGRTRTSSRLSSLLGVSVVFFAVGLRDEQMGNAVG